MVAGVYGLCAQMSERNQDFHNISFLHIRNRLLDRPKLVWVFLDSDVEQRLKKKILEVDKRWKNIKKTAIQFDLRKNWGKLSNSSR